MSELKRKEITVINDLGQISEGYFTHNQSIKRVRFEGIAFAGCRFSHSSIRTCWFVDCSFIDCIFDCMDLQRVWFNACRFSGCVFAPGFRYITGQFVDTVLARCEFPAAFVQNVQWIGSSIVDCSFRGMKAKSIAFVDTLLPGITPDEASITRGDFSSVPGLRRETLYNVRLDDCTLAWNEAFVVMQFSDPLLDNLYDYGIEPTLADLGVDCRRVDRYEFKGRITDEILQGIVTARAVVAECSAANKNVYFEIGYALGRGKEVVFLVDEEHNIPFHLKDYKFIVHHESIDILKEQLSERMRFVLQSQSSGA